uniref:uncharacterized protein LOC109951093 n=1 Tax=Monopterus albus TaxID=43700 RepID=UPI0009B40A6B|nr:uncharacterized protein LOC109951093 [Monopterus albus]
MYQCITKYHHRPTDALNQVWEEIPPDPDVVGMRLPQPSISLTSSNGGLVLSPAEVTRGYSFVITCSINCSYPEGRFFLIFSGSNINKSSVNHSASFDFPVAEYEHQGSYSCVYEVTLSARRFNSTETTPIVVIVKVPLSHLVSSVAGGCLLLLLLVLLVVWLFCTRRRRAKQPEAHVQTPMTDNNHYEDDDNEENYDDEDKGDYVNIELLDTNRKQGEEVEGMEEEENEDYENMTTEDIYIEAVDTFAIVQNNREQEDEEEPSDDEQDYVNVSPDIYLSN